MSGHFIVAELQIQVDGTSATWPEATVSSFGVNGGMWIPFNSDFHFGKDAQLHIRSIRPAGLELDVPATVLREYSAEGPRMGFRFVWSNEESRKKLSQFVLEKGFTGPESRRKHPRIPVETGQNDFPKMARLGSLHPGDSLYEHPLLVSVQNISAGGVLLASENPFAVLQGIGKTLILSIEVPGAGSVECKVNVRWTVDELRQPRSRMVRYYGCQFTEIRPEHRNVFDAHLAKIMKKYRVE